MVSLREIQKNFFFISPQKCNELATDTERSLNIRCTSVNQLVGSLSGGNKQKVNLGRWLIKDLSIIVMDCPTRGVDVGVKAYIYSLMKEMKVKGLSVILISDELSEIIGMADRLGVMKNGMLASIIERTEELDENKIIEIMT
jgi:ribose transport system ATP-binding protein